MARTVRISVTATHATAGGSVTGGASLTSVGGGDSPCGGRGSTKAREGNTKIQDRRRESRSNDSGRGADVFCRRAYIANCKSQASSSTGLGRHPPFLGGRDPASLNPGGLAPVPNSSVGRAADC